jgi:rubrerythrin
MANAPQGWFCPGCGNYHAPSVLTCVGPYKVPLPSNEPQLRRGPGGYSCPRCGTLMLGDTGTSCPVCTSPEEREAGRIGEHWSP